MNHDYCECDHANACLLFAMFLINVKDLASPFGTLRFLTLKRALLARLPLSTCEAPVEEAKMLPKSEKGIYLHEA